jgi:hypothetical protein
MTGGMRCEGCGDSVQTTAPQRHYEHAFQRPIPTAFQPPSNSFQRPSHTPPLYPPLGWKGPRAVGRPPSLPTGVCGRKHLNPPQRQFAFVVLRSATIAIHGVKAVPYMEISYATPHLDLDPGAPAAPDLSQPMASRPRGSP